MRLLKQWLQMPVEESDGRGGKRRSNPARRQGRGTPQGAPMTPRTQKVTSSFGGEFSSSGVLTSVETERRIALIVSYRVLYIRPCEQSFSPRTKPACKYG